MNEVDRIIAQHEADMDKWADIRDTIKDAAVIILAITVLVGWAWIVAALR